MSVSELDTFYFKFKNLLLAEKNATLSLKSDAGRAQVTLSVDLGHLLLEPGPQHVHQVRNSPSRQRRRERRAAARRQAEAEKALEQETAEEAANPATVAVAAEEVDEDELNKLEKSTVPEVIEKVTDEFCPDKEYSDVLEHEEYVNDTTIYDLECWDPDQKWKVQDVYNHMGESLEQMFLAFNMKPEDQQYQLTVLEREEETFNFKLEMKKFANAEDVVNNFRRQGHVPGGGCIKFFRKYL